MKRPVTIVGGAGYIGQRLAPYLVRRGFVVTVVDPCIFYVGRQPPCLGSGSTVKVVDAKTWMKRNREETGPIVYLASFHDCPFWDDLHLTQKTRWEEAAREIMIDVPKALIGSGKEVIYVSSMRALTHQDTFYGNLKAIAERELFQHCHIIRFGTVWGGYDPRLYNRTITVPNNWQLRGELPDENWKAFLTPMDEVEDTIETALCHPSRRGQVWNATRPGTPCTAKDLRDQVPRVEGPHPMREEHPAFATARYYNLPLPKGTP